VVSEGKKRMDPWHAERLERNTVEHAVEREVEELKQAVKQLEVERQMGWSTDIW
jgi:hypothetical protein